MGLHFQHAMAAPSALTCHGAPACLPACPAAEDVQQTPNGDYFVRSSRTKGILPEIREELLGARKRWVTRWDSCRLHAWGVCVCAGMACCACLRILLDAAWVGGC